MMTRRQVVRFGFTIIELMLTIGIIGTIAGIVIAAINPSAQLTTAYDAGRRSTARSLEQAIAQYTIDVGQVPGHVPMPTSAQTAIPICRPSGSGGTCILLNELAPDYLGQIPIDGSEENDEWTGYSVYLDGPQVRVIANNLGTTGNGLLASSTYFGQRMYGGTGGDAGRGIVQLADGNYVVVAQTYSVDGDITSYYGTASSASSSSNGNQRASTADIWLVKISDAGAIMWQRNLGSSSQENAFGIVAINNDVAIVGTTSGSDNDISTSFGSEDIWLAYVDSDGNISWETTYGTTKYDYHPKLRLTSDNKLLLSYSAINLPGYYSTGDFYVAKLELDGTEIWYEQVTDEVYYREAQVVAAADGGHYIVNVTYAGFSFDKITISKRDGSNNEIWYQDYDSTDIPFLSPCTEGIPLTNNGFVLLCPNNATTISFDSLGNIEWRYRFTMGSNLQLRTVTETTDNHLVIVGGSTGGNGLPAFGFMDLLVYRLTMDGVLDWANGYGSVSADYGQGGTAIDDGGIMAVGYGYESDGIDDPVDRTDDVWVLQLNNDGQIVE